MLMPIANHANMLANILINNVGSNVGQHVGTVCEGLVLLWFSGCFYFVLVWFLTVEIASFVGCNMALDSG